MVQINNLFTEQRNSLRVSDQQFIHSQEDTLSGHYLSKQLSCSCNIRIGLRKYMRLSLKYKDHLLERSLDVCTVQELSLRL